MDHKFPYADIQDQQYFSNDGGKCIQCGSGIPEPGYPNKLCAGCRETYIRYPVPKWIWAFGAGILVLVVFGFFRSARFLGHARHMARAEKAMEAHKYVTAAKELEQVLAKFPDRVDANTMMFIASVYNHDMEHMQVAYDKIRGKELSDNKLLHEADEAMTYAAQLYDLDTAFLSRFNLLADDSMAGMQRLIAEVDTNAVMENKPAAYLLIANQLFDYKAYGLCDTLIRKVMAEQENNFAAKSLQAALWRNQGQSVKAMALLGQMLQQNREDVYVLAQMSRTELKQFHDKNAMDFARQAMAIDPHNSVSMEAWAMAEFYAGKKDQSLKLLTEIRQQEVPGDSIVSVRLRDVITGKESFR